MDTISNLVAAWATAYVIANPDTSNKIMKCISWADTISPYVQFAAYLNNIELPDGIDDALDTAERCIPWLVDVLAQKPELRMRIGLG